MSQAQDTASQPTEPKSPFVHIGGADKVRAIVDRFYDLMDQDLAYAELRRMHEPDLGPMRDSLTGFLTAWLGGPRDWFEKRPGACVMSLHAHIEVSHETARQWIQAMSRALADEAVDPALRGRINEAFAHMAAGMAGRG
jgi:hemoglobin